jgi:hypothetical protein
MALLKIVRVVERTDNFFVTQKSMGFRENDPLLRGAIFLLICPLFAARISHLQRTLEYHTFGILSLKKIIDSKSLLKSAQYITQHRESAR